MKYVARVLTAGVPTANGNVYSQELLEKMANDIQTKLEQGRALGTLGCPQSSGISLADVSHRITRVAMDGGVLEVEIELLDTEMGSKALEMCEQGQASLVATGVGTLNDKREVQEDYELIAMSVVPKENAKDNILYKVMGGK